MRVSGALAALGLSLGLATSVAATCDRTCLSDMVTELLASMVAHSPWTLPVATRYKATENGHASALSFMTSWRTIVKIEPVSLLAIDTKQGSAYFATDISEGNAHNKTILRGRVLVVDREFTEIELFINRYRGDHGFSFSAAELPKNYAVDMVVPSNATLATRKELEYISTGLFLNGTTTVAVGDDCQFSELGWSVVDKGNYGNATGAPECAWYPTHPYDVNARASLVIDEELGFMVQSGMIPGKVFGYAEGVSAFIPDVFAVPQTAQYEYLNTTYSDQFSLLTPIAAVGETLEVLQYYNGGLTALQINVYLHPPGATSAWLS